MPMLRWVGFLFIDKSRKLTILLDSKVGLNWMVVWTVSKFCRILSGLLHMES